MGAKLGAGGGPMADINVTPLIDVVLVLLVVFMVVTPMLQSGLPVDLPLATTTETVNDAGQHITVSVTKNGEWAVEQEIVEGEDALINELNMAFNENPERSILLKADTTNKWSEVNEVIKILGEKRFTNIYIAAGKEK